MKKNEISDTKLKVLSALAALVIGCLCWNGGTLSRAQSAPATQSPQLQEIVKLSQAKMGDDVILAYIKNSGAAYNLSADDILYLNSQGVSQPVVSALLQAQRGSRCRDDASHSGASGQFSASGRSDGVCSLCFTLPRSRFAVSGSTGFPESDARGPAARIRGQFELFPGPIGALRLVG